MKSARRFTIAIAVIAVIASLVGCKPPNGGGSSPELPLPSGWSYGSTYLGATEGTRFVLYAPGADIVSVSGGFNSWGETVMNRDGDTFWAEVADAVPGDQYKYRSPDFSGEWIPDPYSRLIANDADSNSVIIDPNGAAAGYSWGDGAWTRPDRSGLLIYEMHVIDFTWDNRTGPAPDVIAGDQGKFDGVSDRVGYLSALGVNSVELMPIQEWPGGYYSWGYNPYLYWAVESSLGTGAAGSEQTLVDFKEMVDTLHQNGIAVIMDVVYNHTTGDSPLYKINPSVFYAGDTAWGPKLDLTNSFVFNHVKDSLEYFMDEFHIDGFRFDSTENIDGTAMRNMVTDLYADGFSDRYYIFEEFSGSHNSAIQSYNSGFGDARISSWGSGYKDGIYPVLSDTGYSELGNITYHSNSYGWTIADSEISYGSSHDEGTFYYHAGLDSQLALTALTHELMSLGLPMIWMGDEVMRDHRGNIPASGSAVDEVNNQMDWTTLMADNSAELSYMQNLIALRMGHDSLNHTLSQPDSSTGSFSDGFEWNVNWADGDGYIGWVRAVSGDYPFAVFVNYGNSAKPYTAFFPQDGTWTLVADSNGGGTPAASSAGSSVGTNLTVSSGSAAVSIPANTAYIYMGPGTF